MSLGHHVFALILVIYGVCSKLGSTKHGQETRCRLQQCVRATGKECVQNCGFQWMHLHEDRC